MEEQRSRGRLWLVVLVVVLVLGLAGGVFALVRNQRGTPHHASSQPLVTQSPTPSSSTPSAGATASTTAKAHRASASCPSVAKQPFDPSTVTVTGVAQDVQVLPLPRDSAGIPGIPPLTSAGKEVFAYDRDQGIAPGSTKGNVLLNAHTWPDGSALGNRLLSGLKVGDRLVVHGQASTKLCYRVSQRIEVSASAGYPKYYATDGPPQLAIIVCSGTRLGPGDWTKRTIWFARASS